MSVKYRSNDANAGAVPVDTQIRTTTTTEGGQVGEIQHVKLDTGDGTNTQPISGTVSANIRDVQTSKDVAVTPIRELKITQAVRLVGTVFEGTEDANFWTKAVTGTGAVTFAGQASIATGTTANSTAKLTSVRKARFIPSSANQFRGIARFTTAGTADNVRRIGAYDANNGYFFQLSGTTFGVGSRSGTTDTVVESGSFNGSTDSYTLNTNVHRFNIDYTNLSAQFYIDDVLIHTISSQTDPSVLALTYPITLENNNSNDLDDNIVLDVRVTNIVRLGNLQSDTASKYQSGTTAGVVCKYGAGHMHGIAVSGVVNNSAITLYDNIAAEGTVLWASGTMGAQTTPFYVPLNVPFGTGLTLVIAAANSTVTVVYE